MIINKVYICNNYSIDEVILELSEEIKKGYTIKYIQYEPEEISVKGINIKPTMHVYLEKKDLWKYEN